MKHIVVIILIIIIIFQYKISYFTINKMNTNESLRMPHIINNIKMAKKKNK